MAAIQAIRGFNDIISPATNAWYYLEQHIRQIADQYTYQEIRCPTLEKTELFIRGVGEGTDIVEKEIYTFTDHNNEQLSLRPEGTAGCVRAAIQHGLLHNQLQRLWYMGPMFRYERPQAGRYRQFYQAGFEAFGVADAYMDAELILMSARLWRNLGLLDKVSLQINSLGTASSRQRYREILINYLQENFDQLDEESKKRLQRNPLRILDSKNPALANVIAQAPKILDYLEPEAVSYFECLKFILAENNIKFEVNPRLVRGLDYYTHAVFEWISPQLGAQSAVCAGGRYDALVEQLGGKPTPAVGFAIGLDRVLLLLELNQLLPKEKLAWLYVVSVGECAKNSSIQLTELLHNHFEAKKIINDTSLSSFKSQVKRADKSGAQLALIIGEDEVKTDTISIKFLREEIPQQLVKKTDIIDFLRKYHDA